MDFIGPNSNCPLLLKGLLRITTGIIGAVLLACLFYFLGWIVYLIWPVLKWILLILFIIFVLAVFGMDY